MYCDADNNRVSEADLAENRRHFEIACKEGYLKGTAENYFAALLMLIEDDDEQRNQAIKLFEVRRAEYFLQRN